MKVMNFQYFSDLILAAGLSRYNSLSNFQFVNNQEIKIKYISAYVSRFDGTSFLVQRGSLLAGFVLNQGFLTERLITTYNGNTSIPGTVTIGFPAESPQQFVDGLVVKPGQVLNVGFTAYNFGVTNLNDGIYVDWLMGYE